MCTTTHFRSRACRHHWLQIRQPCAPGQGFSYCDVFGDGVARAEAERVTVAGLCPACQFPAAVYDKNQVRMVMDIKDRWRWGFGPSKGDPGLECVVIFLGKSFNFSSVVLLSSHTSHREPHPIFTIATTQMLPTPDTSHVAYERIYEPAEDSFLLLDTLSSTAEVAFLQDRFRHGVPPLVVEIGPGSGVVIAFVNAHAEVIFGTRDILTTAIDVNGYACRATGDTVRKAASENPATHGRYLGAFQGDLVTPLRDRSVDLLVFNPPYVPTPDLPEQSAHADTYPRVDADPTFDEDSWLLSLSYAGGKDGMETTDRLIDSLPRVLSGRGCAYILLCAQNKPAVVKERIRSLGDAWKVETVGTSGKQAGWEKLQIIRIWRE
ncbi:methyltransferase domain-containing protein [Xylariaceae sp. FL0662B]|nr:methyltransferase domain-containing protein [Xylariaceae sp. FL0662B]